MRQWKLSRLFANFHVRASKCKLIRKLLDIADKYLHATMRVKDGNLFNVMPFYKRIAIDSL